MIEVDFLWIGFDPDFVMFTCTFWFCFFLFFISKLSWLVFEKFQHFSINFKIPTKFIMFIVGKKHLWILWYKSRTLVYPLCVIIVDMLMWIIHTPCNFIFYSRIVHFVPNIHNFSYMSRWLQWHLPHAIST